MKSDRYQPLARLSSSSRRQGPAETGGATLEERLRRTSAGVLRRWKLLVLFAGLSAIAGYVASEKYSTLSWRLESKLLYSRPAGIASYTPPDADSLSKLFKSPALFARLSDEFEGVTPGQCDGALNVAPPYGSCVVNVSLDWHDPVEGAAILDRSMALFQEQVASQRANALGSVLDGLLARRQRSKEQLAASREAQSEFGRKNGVADVDTELSALRADISEIERQLAAVRSQRAALEAQFHSVANPKHANLNVLVDTATAEHRNHVDSLGQLLAQKRNEYHGGFGFAREASDLDAEVESCTAERQRLDDEISIAEQWRAQPTSGFTVAQSAVANLNSPSSNKRKIFLALTMIGCIAMCVPLMLLEYSKNGRSILADWTTRLGLPILVRFRSMPDSAIEGLELPAEEDLIRLLALRIQQSLERPVSAIMFCGLGPVPTSEWLMWNLSRCFAQRGERVLLLRLTAGDGYAVDQPESRSVRELIATHIAAESSPTNGNGHSASPKPTTDRHQCFTCGHDEVDDLVRPTNLPGVDELRSADLPWPREAWGTRRMTDLLNELRERYTLVLVSGPTVAQPVDLQMLAARVDGIVFSAPRDEPMNPSAAAVVNDLLQLRAPVLGVVA